METEVWNAGELSQEEVISALRNRFEVSYGKAASELFAFMDEAENEFSLKAGKSKSRFAGCIPQQAAAAVFPGLAHYPRGLSTAAIRPAATCLPFPHMADRYGVGMNTIRRALDILEDLGE